MSTKKSYYILKQTCSMYDLLVDTRRKRVNAILNSLFKWGVSKKETCTLLIKNSESCSTIYSAKANESFTA